MFWASGWDQSFEDGRSTFARCLEWTGTDLNVLFIQGDDFLAYWGSIYDIGWVVARWYESDFSMFDASEFRMWMMADAFFRAFGMSEAHIALNHEMDTSPVSIKLHIKDDTDETKTHAVHMSVTGTYAEGLSTGKNSTTFTNSCNNLSSPLHFVKRRSGGANITLEQAAAELGFEAKTQFSDDPWGRSFLKMRIFPDENGELATFPDFSLVFKMGKMLESPTTVLRVKDKAYASGVMLWALAQGAPNVPADYPLIGVMIQKGRDFRLLALACARKPLRQRVLLTVITRTTQAPPRSTEPLCLSGWKSSTTSPRLKSGSWKSSYAKPLFPGLSHTRAWPVFLRPCCSERIAYASRKLLLMSNNNKQWQTQVSRRKKATPKVGSSSKKSRSKGTGGNTGKHSSSSSLSLRIGASKTGKTQSRSNQKNGEPKNFPRFVLAREPAVGSPSGAPPTASQMVSVRSVRVAPAISATKVQRLENEAKMNHSGPAGGDPNRVGRAIDHINKLKNLNSHETGKEMHEMNSRAYKNIEKLMSPEKCMCPDVLRYVQLLDNPLTAEWGDEGEQMVRCPLYISGLPPDKTLTTRAFGQQTISIERGNVAWVVLCGGAGNLTDVEAAAERNDVLYQAAPNTFHTKTNNIISATASMAATLGAPPDGRPIIAGAANTPVGGGAAGLWYQVDQNFASSPPSIETTNQGFISSAAMANWGPGDILQWGTPAPFGEMDADDSSQYKYRPVAYGVLITPADPNLTVGGYFDAQVIPQGTNETYVTRPVAAGSCEGTSQTAADLLALPDHRIKRGDGSIQVNWLPGRQDYHFVRTDALTCSANGVVTPVVGTNTGINNARVFIRITPPSVFSGETPASAQYVISYVGFYEIAGRCIQNEGNVPRPIPSAGAQVATATQNAMNVELDSRESQVSDGTVLQSALDHPVLGRIVEGSDTLSKAKDTIKEVLSFGEELLPFAAMLL
jgi:hypothetical protein